MKRVVLSEIVENKDSKRIPVKASEREEMSGQYPYYGASGIVDYVDDYLFEGPNLLIGEDGANLLSRSTDIAFIAEGKYWVNNHAHVLGADNIETLQYLKYYINSIDLSPYITGSAQPKLNQRNLNKIEVPLPNLSEQKAIVAKLDRAQRLIDIDKEMLAKYDELIQSVFLEMFGMDFENTDTTIGDICEVKGGKRLPKGSSFSDIVTEYPYLRVVDFIPNGIDESQIKYISADLHDKISRYTINVDDLFISIAGTIGIAGLIPDNLDGANLTENAAKLIIKNNDEIRKKYLSYLINSKLTQSFIEMRTMAVGVPKLALFRIKEIPVYIPPVEHQERFEEVVDRIEIEKKMINLSLNKSEELFSSLVQGAFS